MAKKFLSRKFILCVGGALLVALQKPLGLDKESIDLIMYLVLGGAGLIAADDAVDKLRNKDQKK